MDIKHIIFFKTSVLLYCAKKRSVESHYLILLHALRAVIHRMNLPLLFSQEKKEKRNGYQAGGAQLFFDSPSTWV